MQLQDIYQSTNYSISARVLHNPVQSLGYLLALMVHWRSHETFPFHKWLFVVGNNSYDFLIVIHAKKKERKKERK